jgi:hypothetical protein
VSPFPIARVGAAKFSNRSVETAGPWPTANIANQIYAQATLPKMIAQCTVQGKTIEQALDWAASELEGFSRS